MRKGIPLALAGLLAVAQSGVAGTGSPDSGAVPTPPSSRLGSGIESPPPAGDALAPQVFAPAGPVFGPEDDTNPMSSRLWGYGEYLLWWIRAASLPPLVTTSPAGTSQTSAGVLGADGTQILYGGNGVNGDARSGGRFGLGLWIDPKQTWAVTAEFLFLEDKSAHFTASSAGDPILARPFVNATTSAQDAELVAFPGVLSGTVSVNSTSRSFLGTEVNLEETLCHTCRSRVVVMAGFRFLKLDEGVTVTEALTATGTANPFAVAAGTNIDVADSFATRNEFYGGNFGIHDDIWLGDVHLGLLAKLAVGYMHETADISGGTQVTVPGAAPVTNNGGLLALPSNIGHSARSDVALVPEFGLNVGYQVTDLLEVHVGYTFLFWGRVARAADQIDFTVDPSQIPPAGTSTAATRPERAFGQSDLWVQGVSAGLELRY